MSIDTTAISDSVNTFVQLAIGYVPLGINIVIIPMGLVIMFRLARVIFTPIFNALAGPDRS
jgi:hypothetical protein